MITKSIIESFKATQTETDVQFLIELDYWAFVNQSDESCLKLWWNKTKELIGDIGDYSQSIALECIQIAMIDMNTTKTATIH